MNLPTRQTIPQLQQPANQVRRQYNMETRIYYKAGQAIRDRGTFAFMATNIGDKIAVVNGMTLYPGTPGSLLGDSRTVASAYEGYEYVGNIDIKFTGAGTAPALELVTLFYPSDPQ